MLFLFLQHAFARIMLVESCPIVFGCIAVGTGGFLLVVRAIQRRASPAHKINTPERKAAKAKARRAKAVADGRVPVAYVDIICIWAPIRHFPSYPAQLIDDCNC